MSSVPSGTLVKIAPVVFSLFLGGVGGYFFRSKEAAEKLAAVEAVLTEEQKQALQELQPARGGRGGGGRMPGSGGGGMPGSGGAQQDPDKPFASERNKKGLEDLLAALKQPQKP